MSLMLTRSAVHLVGRGLSEKSSNRQRTSETATVRHDTAINCFQQNVKHYLFDFELIDWHFIKMVAYVLEIYRFWRRWAFISRIRLASGRFEFAHFPRTRSRPSSLFCAKAVSAASSYFLRNNEKGRINWLLIPNSLPPLSYSCAVFYCSQMARTRNAVIPCHWSREFSVNPTHKLKANHCKNPESRYSIEWTS